MRRLGPREAEASTVPALLSVFASLSGKDQPFKQQVRHRLLLETESFVLSEVQFEAVCSAARAVGDRTFCLSFVKGYLGEGLDFVPHYTWEMELFDYEAYCSVDSRPNSRNHDIGITLDRALYSPQGTWGILCSDGFALLGGSADFVRHFKIAYPNWSKDLNNFLYNFQIAARSRGVDTRWIPPLLAHVYGESAPAFEI